MLTVEVTRGSVVESVHAAWACATDIEGRVLHEAARGDAHREVFLRSAAKPFQAASAVTAGVLERLGLDDRHLAIACASHDGSPSPVAVVAEILDAAGLDDTAVRAGSDGQGGILQHQCSGNHALALAWCVVEGWPTDSYLDRDHPVQRAMQTAVAAATGVEPHLEADNCGMTAHQVPLAAIATAFARLAVGWGAVPGLDRVAAAMRAHPFLVRQGGQADSELMAASPALVAKFGAESVVGIGDAAGVGAAVRVVDGGMRALGPAAVTVARRWSLGGEADGPRSPALDVIAEPPVLDGHGQPVGVIRAVLAD